ncbi:peptidase C65 Otubain-domain-containing protein [Calycina marina]|uniref:ubiquitinyl hydrolase 1 n=1 Tax=Calycina marina TaxID=1763456 RepID=A0A9P8CHQ7_9HELO|nr:peptidase C65 Otubain-domain-containing protein [Calycina marina]
MEDQHNNVFELAEQRRLAQEYDAHLEGPMVGEKKSSHAITEEYARADPVYIAKTQSLPQTYSHYRPILGDGNCGWRAIAFAYFEKLLQLSDAGQFELEIARLVSLDNYIETVGGQDPSYFMDMTEETIELLKDLLALLDNPQVARNTLLERFNDNGRAPSIIYHMRLLAVSWLRGHAEEYQGFLDGSIEDYCTRDLMAVNAEIDHMGMTLLIDIFIKPVGLSVEIVYLDRSEGTEVNTHIYRPIDQSGVSQIGPMIYILYRPGHYDLLYKERSSYFVPHPAATMASNVQVNRATSFSRQHDIQQTQPTMENFSNVDIEFFSSIPGFCVPPPSNHGFPTEFPGFQQAYDPSPVSTSVSPDPSMVCTNSSSSSLSIATTFTPQHSSSLSAAMMSPQHSNHSSHSPFSTIQLPIHTLNSAQPQPLQAPLSSHHSPQHGDVASPPPTNSTFRPSKYEWEAIADWQEGPVIFQTSTFKNSHYNTAHYNNPNFQPEEWSPDCEEAFDSSGRKKST